MGVFSAGSPNKESFSYLFAKISLNLWLEFKSHCMADQRYIMRGVSATKEDVHNAIKNIDKGLYPTAFCKIIPDILGGDP